MAVVGFANLAILGPDVSLSIAQYQASVLILCALNDLAATRQFQARSFSKLSLETGSKILARELAENNRIVTVLVLLACAYAENADILFLFMVSLGISAASPTRIKCLRAGSLGKWFALDSLGPLFFLSVSVLSWIPSIPISASLRVCGIVCLILAIIVGPYFFRCIFRRRFLFFSQLKRRKSIALEAVALTYILNSLAFMPVSGVGEKGMVYIGTRVLSLVKIVASSMVNNTYRSGRFTSFLGLTISSSVIVLFTVISMGI